jgi:hypothetical protein
MSESVFARLPRFDVAEPAFDVLADLVPEETAAPEEEAPVFAPPPVEARAPDRDVEIEAALSALLNETKALRHASQQAIVEAISAFSAGLFPNLTEQFLAEEIARELPALLHQLEGPIEICAAPDLCEALENAMQRLVVRTGTMRFKASSRLAPGEIQIHWAAGGANYDHARLLQTLRRRFETEITPERKPAS